jgi:hypothetical protein
MDQALALSAVFSECMGMTYIVLVEFRKSNFSIFRAYPEDYGGPSLR